ncbi:hypothetical protein A7U60_g4526 [Sanghuangporus baumii]|uniref:Protein BIG1 n=1 Tax=Sanghuangporus baumii TaxID=108892 RepID=A0A9Q5NC93_SANBA|nr:hypothetical protein A7U60_g4526 [Sanghuangporus baumii]
MLSRLIAVTTLFPLSWAFYDTVPLVAWSSHENELVRTLADQRTVEYVREGGVERLLLYSGEGEDVCSGFETLVVFEQPGLHATDLKSLPPSSSLPERLKAAKKSVQIPYVKQRSLPDEGDSDSSTSSGSLESVVEELARRCGAGMTWLSVDGLDWIEEGSKEKAKNVFYLGLPEVNGEGSWRRYKMGEIEDTLTRTLEKIESTFPNHLMIYTGSLSSSSSILSKRQDESIPDRPFAFAPSNSTTPDDGGILARYQLLTPGLIVSLLIAFFVLLPVVLISVQALASIESPVRLDAPRGVTQSKKTQ